MNAGGLQPEIEAAIAVLRRGGLVGLPTETVYGLAGDADNDAAIQRIFAAKGRPGDHPLIVHIGSGEEIHDWAREVSDAALALIDVCWPGPLTVIVAKSDRVLPAITGGRASVALRVPAHPLATAVLQGFGGGLAAPSANRYGRVSPTTAADVRDELGDLVDLVLDGGACPVGVESTIVDCTVEPPQILRCGGIDNEQISQILGGRLATATGPSRASGMLRSHYAPSAVVELVDSRPLAERRAEFLTATGATVDIFDPTLDLVAGAQTLFSRLRDADRRRVDTVIAVLPPPAGLGHAIRDRLIKAAGRGGELV